MNLRDKWLTMQCPFCQVPMDLKHFQQVFWQGQERLKSIYRCDTCPYVTTSLTTREQAAGVLGGEGWLPYPLASPHPLQ